MPTITVKYADGTRTTVAGTSIPITAVSGGDYRHGDKVVDRVAFSLGSATTATVEVAAVNGQSMPAQTCYADVVVPGALPCAARWQMQDAARGFLNLTIASTATETHRARLEVIGGGKVEISFAH